MDKVRFGICGLGCMGRSHFHRLRQNPRAEIRAVCDLDPARRAGDWNDALGNMDLVATGGATVSMEGINAYESAEQLVADPDVDAVLITLPTPWHAPVAVAALQADKHVLTEKPMATKPGECNRMIAAALKARRTLMVGQCLRFWPQYETIKNYVDSGRIGSVRFAVLRRLGSPPTYSSNNWLLDGHQSGGAALDLHVHDIDFAQVLFGVPDRLYAVGTPGPSGGYDHIVANYAYADGRYALIEGGWALTSVYPFEMAITVHGSEGTLEWSMSRGNDVQLYKAGQPVESLPCEGDALRREQDYFIDCILSGQPVTRCTPESCRTSIALAWLERRSAELGREVQLSPRLRSAWGV